MKNIEKFQRTKDAIEAWGKCHGDGDLPFAAWAEQEYVDPNVPTLLEAADEAVAEWRLEGFDNDKISALLDAVTREKAKPVRNFDKYKTSKKAYDSFMKTCSGAESCDNCRFRVCRSIAACAIAWLYAYAEKETVK